MSVDVPLLQDDALIVSWQPFKIYAATPEDAGVRVGIKRVDTSLDVDPLRAIEKTWETFRSAPPWSIATVL